MEACGVDFDALKTTDMYVGHEALVLDYERSLTRIDSRTDLPYDTSAHFLWIGERARGIDDAHVDFLSKVRNPIGVKLGPQPPPKMHWPLSINLTRIVNPVAPHFYYPYGG